MSYRRRRRRKPKPYLVKPPPFLEDSTLEGYSAGVLTSEGFPYCATVRGRRYLRIAVSMCDPEAVAKVAKVWGTSVTPRKYKEPECKPTKENPLGQEFLTVAGGERARQIIERYSQKGLLTREFERKLARAKRRCASKRRRP